jgi:hypothetical protein
MPRHLIGGGRVNGRSNYDSLKVAKWSADASSSDDCSLRLSQQGETGRNCAVARSLMGQRLSETRLPEMLLMQYSIVNTKV